MSELRAPDPTLTALLESTEPGRAIVMLDAWPGDPPTDQPSVAHRLKRVRHMDAAFCGADDVSMWASTTAARWFAVPCRKCFPEAPPPGRSVRDEFGRGPVGDPNLSWQVGS